MSSNQRANYRLVPSRTFLKNLEKLDREINRRITTVLEGLAYDPFLGKPLRGDLNGLYSLRIGDFRVIYSVDQNKSEIILHAAKHRSKVYDR
ncbi:MAG: type II toxin-antitoxin system RelE family toxin [Nitrososphaerales archaeon]